MAGMNPGIAAGGPVGGGMMNMMNSNSPAMQVSNVSPEHVKAQLNTYIYEYFLKLGYFDIARQLVKEEKFEIRCKPSKSSPGRRKDAEVNGIDTDAMDTDMKDDLPDDLPRPQHYTDSNTPGIGFLFEWFSIFSDLFTAHQRSSKMSAGQGGNIGPAAQYLMQHQNMQRMRENQQNQGLRPNMMRNPQFAMQANMRNGMMNGNMPRTTDMTKSMTPQQLQQLQQAKMMQQAQMNRENQDVEMAGRTSSPAEGENGGSPSKRPRLEGQQFNGGMMPNGRPGMPGVAPQGMMIQNSFQPNMNPQAQFRQGGGMPQKGPMQGQMPNGMMNMANAGSPMMQAGLNPGQFNESMQMEMYNQRMGGQQMPGGQVAGQSGNHALQDYQMQLMLLEQQNKKRLMMARQEQDNAVNRDNQPMGMVQPGMSPARSGASPNPTDQMKRTPQLGGMPGSPSAGGEGMPRGSPGPMAFMNGIPTGEFNPALFMKDAQGMAGPGGPMRPPTSMDVQQAMNRQQAQARMGAQFQGGQPMVQQPSQGQNPPMGTPGQRSEMPPPSAPPVNNNQRNQPSSPQSSNAPPTPSTGNKPNPKTKKGKDDTNKKRPAKKNSTVPPPAENEPPATPTSSTPMTPMNPGAFNSGGKAGGPGMPNPNQPPPNAGMGQNPQMHQPDLGANNFTGFAEPDQNFNLDFSTLENSDVLENFDFDSFLNTTTDDTFNFDGGIGVGGDFGLDGTGE